MSLNRSQGVISDRMNCFGFLLLVMFLNFLVGHCLRKLSELEERDFQGLDNCQSNKEKINQLMQLAHRHK